MRSVMSKVCGAMLGVMMATGGHAADGGVGFSRNRLVFAANERAISLTVMNHGKDPAKDVFLVQAGVGMDANQTQRAPFVVTPPLFRLDANSQNEMRIVPTGANLPTDRESVFYFAATVIPSTPDKGKVSGSQVTFATRTILKLFWRPQALGVTPQEALKSVRFVRDSEAVVVKNPTPYYQSFASLAFDGRVQNLDTGPSMVPPFGELRLPVHGGARSVTWQVMNDYGGATEKKTQPVVAG